MAEIPPLFSDIDPKALQFEVIYNNANVEERCPLCHDKFQAFMGDILSLAGTYQPVCDNCSTFATLENTIGLKHKAE